MVELLRQEIPFERLVGAMDRLVESGDPRSIQYMFDRHLGRPAQAVHVTGDAERPLHMLVGVQGRDLAPEQRITGPEQDAIEGEAEAVLIEGTAPDDHLAPVPEGWGDGAVSYLDEG